MLTFAAYTALNENARITRAPWIRATAIAFAMKVRSLENDISNADDNAVRLSLLAKQNAYLSYLSALNIATDLDDRTLQSRVRSFRRN